VFGLTKEERKKLETAAELEFRYRDLDNKFRMLLRYLELDYQPFWYDYQKNESHLEKIVPHEHRFECARCGKEETK